MLRLTEPGKYILHAPVQSYSQYKGCLFPDTEKASIEELRGVTEDFAFPDWNIYFANPPISVINEALHDILRGRREPMLKPKDCLEDT